MALQTWCKITTLLCFLLLVHYNNLLAVMKIKKKN